MVNRIKSPKKKKAHVMPKAMMVNSDLMRIVSCDKIQSVVRPIKN